MSKIEVNQISSQCGSTLTIGQSGDTVTLACGATQTGFGRTGTVDWCTTAKTAPFTGVSGKGYFVNTTCGAVTVTLPATPTAGDIISVKDYARTAATNNINFCRNGSKMDGDCANSGISTNGESTTLIYVDGTKGWTSILDNTTAQYGAQFIVATGGTITCCGDYKIHIFTADGCFSVSNAGNPAGSTTVDYLVVAGGGGGGCGAGANSGGGGGAGGYRTNYPSGCAGIPVSITNYPITVGSGGAVAIANPVSGGPPGTAGSNSIFSTITSAGGGAGGGESPYTPGTTSAGGSGGGAAGQGSAGYTGGTGNTPPVSPPQGNNGGNAGPSCSQGGGGGGAGAVGGNATLPTAGTGGVGSPIATVFFGPTSPSYGTPGPAPGRYFSGGGGGGASPGTVGQGGDGGGGAGGLNCGGASTSGTANTGGGGGGMRRGTGSGNGGSGIVVVRYKFQ
jgi:hypothetical protein